MGDNNVSQFVQRNIVPLPLTSSIPKISILDQINSSTVRKIDLPVVPSKMDIDSRLITLYDPDIGIEKKAHVMLRIKRKKMRRHKYEKRQRKLRFVFLRLRRSRYAKEENQFRSEIAMKLKELEKFDPAAYVNKKLEQYRQVVLPNRIKGGVRMPPFVIIECLEKKKKLRELKDEFKERKRKFMVENGGTLDVKE